MYIDTEQRPKVHRLTNYVVAIPGVCCFNALNSRIRDIISDTEGFADELMGRIACEFQGRNA